MANFIVGLSVLIVPGMLTTLAQAFSVSIPVAGQLVTVAAVVMGIGAPTIAAITSRIDRRQLLMGSLALFAVGHFVCTLTDNFAVLTVVRAITVISAAIVTPQAAATLGLLVPANQRASSLAAIFVGWSLASVIAMPLANVLAKHWGWQWPFYIAGFASAATIFWISKAIPKGLVVPALTLKAWSSVFKHPVLIPVLLVTLLSFTAQFMLFSFLVPFLEKGFGFGQITVPMLLLTYGIFGVLGNSLAVKVLPRLGANRFVTYGLSAIAISAVLLGLAFTVSSSNFVLLLVVVALAIWGLAGFACNSAQQGRLMNASPELASASMALNTSALYIGQGIGTPLGALLITSFGYAALPWAVACAALFAIGASLYASRSSQKYNQVMSARS